MTQSVFVSGVPGGRAKNGKHLREIVADNPARVSLEATSIFGNEYEGPITRAPLGTYVLVLPHPYNRRYYPALVIGEKDGERTYKVK